MLEPDANLKELQRFILHNCIPMHKVHPAAYGYVPGRSILDCAQQHVGATWMIKIDLKDFFSSIDEYQVFKVFSKVCGYSNLVAFELTRLCTYPLNAKTKLPNSYRCHIVLDQKADDTAKIHSDQPYQGEANSGPYLPTYQNGRKLIGVLPQGVPTSGMLANLCAQPFDETITAYLDKAWTGRIAYTRYSDDIVISFAVYNNDFGRSMVEKILSDILEIIRTCGFTPNNKKIRIIPPGARKIILGLLVDDEGVHLTPEFKKEMRYHIRGVAKFGLQNHLNHLETKPPLVSWIQHMEGKIAYAEGIEPRYGYKLKRSFRTACEEGRQY